MEGKVYHFFIGALGAFVIYFFMYRERRIRLFLKEPRRQWRVFVFDLLGYLVCGGLVTTFALNPASAKEAFLGGCTWQGLIGGTLIGTELKVQKTVEREGQD